MKKRGRPPLAPELRAPRRAHHSGAHRVMSEEETRVRADLREKAREKIAASLRCPPDRVTWAETARAIGISASALADKRVSPKTDAAIRAFVDS